MERKRYRNPSGSLRDLIEYEYLRCGVTLPGGTMEGYRFLRLAPYPGRALTPKLAHARMPVMIVHAANDPLAPAQDVVDLLAEEQNPRAAGIILPNGGHVGFANYAPKYTYSLVASFFDEAAGAAGPPPADLATGGAPSGAALEN
jgi:pimeloyl-ACP methyl ester carboxylesterase